MTVAFVDLLLCRALFYRVRRFFSEKIVKIKLQQAAAVLFALAMISASAPASAQSKVTIAVGGGACLCYLPTVLAKQLGEYEKAGLAVELVDLKGGSDALKAVLGGSADVVSGYFDHCVNLAAKKQELVSFVVYDRYPGLVLVASPSHTAEIKSIKDLAGKKVGVSAPGSSTDFFLKYLLKKNGVDPASVAVIGVGLGGTSVAAMEQGQWQPAEDLLKKALDTAPDDAATHRSMAEVLWHRGARQEAIVQIEDAADVADRSGVAEPDESDDVSPRPSGPTGLG